MGDVISIARKKRMRTMIEGCRMLVGTTNNSIKIDHKRDMLELMKRKIYSPAMATRRLRDDESFWLEALKHDPLCFKYASARLRKEGDFAFRAIVIAPKSIDYIDPEHPRHDELVVAASHR